MGGNLRTTVEIIQELQIKESKLRYLLRVYPQVKPSRVLFGKFLWTPKEFNVLQATLAKHEASLWQRQAK